MIMIYSGVVGPLAHLLPALTSDATPVNTLAAPLFTSSPSIDSEEADFSCWCCAPFPSAAKIRALNRVASYGGAATRVHVLLVVVDVLSMYS